MKKSEKQNIKFKSPFNWYLSGIFILGIVTGVLLSVLFIQGAFNTTKTKNVVENEKDKCISSGGAFSETDQKCLFNTNDASKECTKNTDCEGMCLAPEGSKIGEETKGTCSSKMRETGCVKFIDNGKVNEICF